MCCKFESNTITRSGSFNYRGGVYGPYRGCEEAIWLRGLLEELGVELNSEAVNCDNQGAIHLSRKHVFHERTKYINVRYHFIREVLEAKMVKVLKVGTEHNAADALTKVVPELKLQHCLELLNVDINDSDNQYAVSIKEDTAYPCLHSPKTTKESSSIRFSSRLRKILVLKAQVAALEESTGSEKDADISSGIGLHLFPGLLSSLPSVPTEL
ncbi:hypothetical protein Tco_1066785 [Tanacetum coccineum]|uniref:Uncharacterized protein n=1 Tax=Tanacetum coccineum TaxID=301880 RepID=A0ABQ5HAZ1_9ASTR